MPLTSLTPDQSGPDTSEVASGQPLLGELLVAEGHLSREDLDWALPRQRRHLSKLGEILIRHGIVSEKHVYDALARQYRTPLVSSAGVAPSFAMIDRLGPEWCLRNGILPVRRAGAVTLVCTSRPHLFDTVRDHLEKILGPVAMQVMSDSDLEGCLARARRRFLAAAAENRTPEPMSTRSMAGRRRWVVGFGTLAAFLLAAALAPIGLFATLAATAIVVLALNTGLVLFATYFGLGQSRPEPSDPMIVARLPRVSLLVPLFKERDIAGALVGRISLIEYPRELLDICLVVEADDLVTRQTLANTELPPWMQVISVPPGEIQTKPRAMNYALDFCDGAIIGVYDAEDAPAPDQILRVVRQFARSAPEVACLQGRLNFYNHRASWLSRCFAVDYATWFTLVLPALRGLGWAIPLGGTTVFFRREVLESIGAWDAHNVTEDADLGMRLARHGYVTDLLDSTTLEEATVRPLPWIKQRSRWLKGYAVTYAVHMRDPVALWRDLGAWRFFGFQVLFLCSLSGTLLAPVLWSFWLPAFGLPHPLAGVLSPVATLSVMCALVLVALTSWASNATALLRMKRGALLLWLPAMHLYYPLATFAILKAIVELVFCPFFWDKTAHGVSLPDQALPTAEDPEPLRA